MKVYVVYVVYRVHLFFSFKNTQKLSLATSTSNSSFVESRLYPYLIKDGTDNFAYVEVYMKF